MKRFAAASFLVLISLTSSLAADFPTRKAGLWQVSTTTANGRAISVQQCVDAQTDQAMQSRFASTPQRSCSKRNVQRSGDTITIDTVCTIGGQTRSSHMVVTGSFDSNYTMTMTSQVQGLPAPRTTTTTAKWLGPCAAGQKPGDMIMPNGKTMNILDMRGAMPGAAGAPMTPHH
jgi:hypothetical protein